MCTSIQMKAADGSVLFARTMDWHFSAPHPIELPAGYAWRTVYNGKIVQNQYAILGIGHVTAGDSGHADISDGMNTAGLAAQKLTFSNASEYAVAADNDKIQLAAFEFVMWLLGNCASVAEISEKLENVQLMTDEFSAYKFGRNDLHFAATDLTGRMVRIEPLDGKLQVFENPVSVMTNAPKFDREVAKLTDYLELTENTSGINRISTGSFRGKLAMPGGFTPTARFVRATVLKDHAITPADSRENLIETMHILNAVTVPKSETRSDTYTIYRSAVDLQQQKLYYQSYDAMALEEYAFHGN